MALAACNFFDWVFLDRTTKICLFDYMLSNRRSFCEHFLVQQFLRYPLLCHFRQFYWVRKSCLINFGSNWRGARPACALKSKVKRKQKEKKLINRKKLFDMQNPYQVKGGVRILVFWERWVFATLWNWCLKIFVQNIILQFKFFRQTKFVFQFWHWWFDGTTDNILQLALGYKHLTTEFWKLSGVQSAHRKC